MLESQQRESAVAIGVAGRSYPLDQMPGWQEGSIAFHLDDGNLFVQVGSHCIIARAGGGARAECRCMWDDCRVLRVVWRLLAGFQGRGRSDED